MISSVEDQVLAHDRQANETEITTGFGLRRADLEASQSRTKVSILFVNLGMFSKEMASRLQAYVGARRGSRNRLEEKFRFRK
jgi:hypothetical protein